ncbi:MAG: hypothetical protein ABR503_15790 [Chitinophagaceae bacterium]
MESNILKGATISGLAHLPGFVSFTKPGITINKIPTGGGPYDSLIRKLSMGKHLAGTRK